MKWTKPVPKIGDKRTRKVFLWFPECITKDHQRTYYWLQFMKVNEEYQKVRYCRGDYINEAYEEWDQKEWVLVSMEEIK